MKVGVQEHPKAFVIRFQDLDLWNVGSQLIVKWGWTSEDIRALRDVLSRRIEPLGDDIAGEQLVHLLTIRFDGSIEPRPSIPRKEIKGRLFCVCPGDVVFSKIDVRNGAIGLVPESIENACVTSEFPVYSVRLKQADPLYIKMLFRTKVFMRILNSMISGASGRKRIQPKQLENVVVPVPPLQVQQAIVEYWKKAQAVINFTDERISQIEQKISDRFITDLGIILPKFPECPKAFAVYWKEFERWSVSYNQSTRNMINLTQGRYPVMNLGSFLEMVQYGTSEKANSDKVGIPVLRINNIKDGKIDISDLKHILLQETTLEGLCLREGDILIIRTSGSRGLVGTCAVFHETGIYVFASYLIRLRVSSEKANPDYIAWYINSTIGRHQVDSLSRHIMQNNINSQELRSLQIALPPLKIQHEIMKRVAEGRAEIDNERGTSQRLRRETRMKIEEMILGIRPIEGI